MHRANDLEEIASFPAPLRALLDAELAAGNSVVEIGHGFPSPPAGAWAMLAHPVSTRARQAGDGLNFRSRNWHAYSFEWSDAQGHFFVLEPALPLPPQPGMDEIRAAHAPGAVVRVPEPAAPRALAAGEFTVEIDYRGEMLIYREAERQADVICTWGRRPTIARRTLSGWWYPAETRSQPMEEGERETVLGRIVERLRAGGTAQVDFED